MSDSLREALSSAFEEVGQEIPAVETVEAPAAETPTETIAETPQETADRVRDEKGRFAAKTADAQAVEAATPNTDPAVAAPDAPAPLQRPSSWKKDYWDRWEKVSTEDRSFAEYLLQREQDFAKGVSQYKTQWDTARPIVDAMQPFLPILQEHGIQPQQWIQSLGTAHHKLATGSLQDKIQMFHKLATDYGVPLQAFLSQDGQVAPQYQQPMLTESDVQKKIREALEEHSTRQQIESFKSNEQYKHFEEVRETMAGLLQAGLARDLPDAYQAALRLPQHAEIYDSMQEQQRADAEAERKRKAQEAASRARANAVSVPSATPMGASSSGKETLRDQLSSAFDAVAGGRV